jgi:hypothetical protein
LDRVADWKYSISVADLASDLKSALSERGISFKRIFLGQTSFSTVLAFNILFPETEGASVTLVPASGCGAESDNAFVLNEWYRIATSVSEPNWVSTLLLPLEEEIRGEIRQKLKTLEQLQGTIAEDELKLADSRKWYRLLFDDGFTLEAITKDALELLGAKVTKPSPNKDDFRVVVSGQPEAVVEVKGTHNKGFSVGALRQLAAWMDEVNATEQKVVKGIFIGNAARNDPPKDRGTIFEEGNNSYAKIKNIVIIRAMDIYCLCVLRIMGDLDLNAFWTGLFGCQGSFNCGAYWERLPDKFALIRDSKSGQSD